MHASLVILTAIAFIKFIRAQDALADVQCALSPMSAAAPKAETPPPSPSRNPSKNSTAAATSSPEAPTTTAANPLTPRTELRTAVDSALVEAENSPRLATWFDKKAVKRFGTKRKRFVELNTLGAEIR